MEILIILLIALPLWGGCSLLKSNRDKKRIRNHYRLSEYDVLKISSDALMFGFFDRDNEDYYRVVLRNKKQKLLLKSCKTNALLGVKEFEMKDKVFCEKCLKISDEYHTLCPDCGSALGS